MVRSRVDGVEAGLRDVTKTLAALGEKMDRLAELTLAIQETATSTASAVEVTLKKRGRTHDFVRL